MRTKTTAVLFIMIFSIFAIGCGPKRIIVVAPGALVPQEVAKGSKVVQMENCESLTDPTAQQLCARKRTLLSAAVEQQTVNLSKKKQDEFSKEAWKELIENPEKARHAQVEAVGRSELSGCPVGSVWLDPRLFRRTGSNLHAVYLVSNPEDVPVDIRDNVTRRVVIKNLCPHGIIGLDKSLASMPYGVNSVQVGFTAFGTKNGRLAKSVSPTTQLIANQGDSLNLQPIDWTIKLQIQ